MVFSILLVFSVIYVVRNEKVLNLSSFLLVCVLYFVCYALFPLVFLNVQFPYDYNGSWLAQIKYDRLARPDLYYSASFLGFSSFILFVAGYNISRFRPRSLFNIDRYNSNEVKKIAWLILIFGAACLFGYILIFGSFEEMMLANTRMTNKIDVDDATSTDSSFTFLFMLMKVIFVSAYLFWGLSKLDINKESAFKVVFWLAFILSLVVLLRVSGRLVLITFVSTFLISSFIWKDRLPKFKAIFAAFLVIFIILFGKSIFRIFIYEDSFSNTTDKYLSEEVFTPLMDLLGGFSFPYLSLVHNLNIDHKYLFFEDLFKFPLYVLPTKLFPFAAVDTTITVNTYNMTGEFGGSIPPDIVNYGLLNLGLLGVVIISVSFGALCKYIDSFKRRNVDPISLIMTIALIFIVSMRVMYFEPRQLIRGYFYFLAALFFIKQFVKPSKAFEL